MTPDTPPVPAAVLNEAKVVAATLVVNAQEVTAKFCAFDVPPPKPAGGASGHW